MSSILNEYPLWYYSRDAKDWKKCRANAPVKVPKDLKVMSFNVLFNLKRNYYKDWLALSFMRYDAIIQIIKKEQPDVIGLSEITLSGLNHFIKHPYIRTNYMSSMDTKGSLITARHGNLLLTKIKFDKIVQCKVTDGRCNLIAGVLEYNNIKIIMGVIHLTAYVSRYKTRQKQIKALNKFKNDNYPNHAMIVVGDFNMHSNFEDAYIPKDWLDVWCDNNKGYPFYEEKGYTFDSKWNLMIKMMYKFEHFSRRRMRLDRIFYKYGNEYKDDKKDEKKHTKSKGKLLNDRKYTKSKDGKMTQYKPIDIKIIGIHPVTSYLHPTKKITGTNKLIPHTIFPSDHFGLISHFKLEHHIPLTPYTWQHKKKIYNDETRDYILVYTAIFIFLFLLFQG